MYDRKQWSIWPGRKIDQIRATFQSNYLINAPTQNTPVVENLKCGNFYVQIGCNFSQGCCYVSGPQLPQEKSLWEIISVSVKGRLR